MHDRQVRNSTSDIMGSMIPLTSFVFTLLLLKSLAPNSTAQTTTQSIILPHAFGPHKFQAYLVGSFVTQTDLAVHYDVAKPALELAIAEVNRRYPSINFNLQVIFSQP